MTTHETIMRQARRELDAVRPVNYQLTPAEYKRRLYLINDEKNQLRAALGLAPITTQQTTGDLFQ
jgi:hypothetical protein|tara:strand:+ start:533 stop:727 length:195 start_codon:yes stop_codon:yes gene_type:complete